MERRLRGIDILGLLLALLSVAEMAGWLAVQPRIRSLFGDLGVALPLFARLMLEPALMVVIGLIPLVLVAEGIVLKRSEPAQVARCIVAMVVVLGLATSFLAALTVPLQLRLHY